MEKVFQVFVSSTYADLASERRRVSETLAKAGYIPAGMELFPATDQQQLDFIKRAIERCDYYVLIIGGRYGSLADENISYTEREYEYAVQLRIPVLAFLHGAPEAIPVGKTDQDSAKAQKLKVFRDKIASGRLVDYWTEPNELCTKVVIAVGQTVNLMPGIGWIRGDQAIDPKLVQDFEKIRTENEELKRRIAEFNTDKVDFPESLMGPKDDFSFSVVVERDGEAPQTIPGDWQIQHLLAEIADEIISESSEKKLGSAIAGTYMRIFHGRKIAEGTTYRMVREDLVTLRFHLEAIGLIRAVGRATTRSMMGIEMRDEYIAWSITEKGRRYISGMWAIPRRNHTNN